MLTVKIYDIESGMPEAQSPSRYLRSSHLVATFKNVVAVNEAIVPSHVALVVNNDDGSAHSVMVPVKNYLIEIHDD
jgi:hypothetical protein